MGSVFSNYWARANSTFVVLHSLVAFLCLLLLISWLWRVFKLRTAGLPDSDGALNRLLAPLEPYGSYFDFCSSAFIFVGLIGTMNGFVNGIPELRRADYDFADLQRALSTSAAGILWSLIFNLITFALDFALLRPLLAPMRANIRGDALESSIRRHLSQIDSTLLRTLETFDRSTAGVKESIDAWGLKIDTTQTEYQKIADGIKETAGNFMQTYKALLGLPEIVREQLAQVFQQSSASLKVVLDEIITSLASLTELPKQVETSLDQSFAERKSVLDQALAAYRDSLEQQSQQLKAIFEKTDDVPLRIGETLKMSGEANVALIKATLEPFLENLREAVRRTVQDQILILASTSSDLKTNAGDLRNKWTELLDREKVAMRDAMVSALQESIKIVDQQRENLLRLESALPESLSATFTTLIQETQQASRALTDATLAHRESSAEMKKALRDVVEQIRDEGRRNADEALRRSKSRSTAPASIIIAQNDGPSITGPRENGSIKETTQVGTRGKDTSVNEESFAGPPQAKSRRFFGWWTRWRNRRD
jgi:hypothetical protein